MKITIVFDVEVDGKCENAGNQFFACIGQKCPGGFCSEDFDKTKDWALNINSMTLEKVEDDSAH